MLFISFVYPLYDADVLLLPFCAQANLLCHAERDITYFDFQTVCVDRCSLPDSAFSDGMQWPASLSAWAESKAKDSRLKLPWIGGFAVVCAQIAGEYKGSVAYLQGLLAVWEVGAQFDTIREAVKIIGEVHAEGNDSELVAEVDDNLVLTNAVAAMMSAQRLMTARVMREYFVSSGLDADVVNFAITLAFSQNPKHVRRCENLPARLSFQMHVVANQQQHLLACKTVIAYFFPFFLFLFLFLLLLLLLLLLLSPSFFIFNFNVCWGFPRVLKELCIHWINVLALICANDIPGEIPEAHEMTVKRLQSVCEHATPPIKPAALEEAVGMLTLLKEKSGL